jgi:hypothetical protein
MARAILSLKDRTRFMARARAMFHLVLALESELGLGMG